MKQVMEDGMSVNGCVNKIKGEFVRVGDEIVSEMIKVSLMCPYFGTRIVVPARTPHCGHLQCFDLEHFLTVLYAHPNSKPSCPICGVPVLALQLDTLMYCLLLSYSTVPNL